MPAVTYDLTTDIGRVRRDIADTDVTTPQFTDEEIQSFLTEGHGVKSAAALALLAWAVALAREDESVSTGAWKGDRRDVAAKMRALAEEYRQLAATEAERLSAFVHIPVRWRP